MVEVALAHKRLQMIGVVLKRKIEYFPLFHHYAKGEKRSRTGC
jgi:hypothetical protein